MLEINTIEAFQGLPGNHQTEILKALRTKDRLDKFLLSQNKRRTDEPTEAHWKECSKCKPFWEKAQGQRGYVWIPAKRDDNDIHPSQIHKCLKVLYYSCSGRTAEMEEFIEPVLRRIFDIGSAWHIVMQDWYGRKGAWCDPADYHPEVAIDPDAVTFDGKPALSIAERYWIRGHVDAVIDRYICENVPGIGDVSVRVVHEYKTMKESTYQHLNSPSPDHKKQATMYSAVFNVPIAVYMYLNKNTSQMADFPLPFDYSLWRDITTKIDRVQELVNNEQEPPWEETSAVKNQAECRECGFRKICNPPLSQIQTRRTA